MVQKNNSSKKSDNKKIDYKKTNNTKTIVAVIVCAIISVSVLLISFTVDSTTLPETSTTLPETSTTLPETSTTLPETSTTLPETSTTLPEKSSSMSKYVESMSDTHIIQIGMESPYIEAYFTQSEIDNAAGSIILPVEGTKLVLHESTAQIIIEHLKPNNNSVVIYPIFTSAAYYEPGFYTYFKGDCDESCITDISFENFTFSYTSSGLTAQILYHVGYDFLTDIEVDQNPELLQNYDTVILLHNEYVTKKAFDAISSHSNLIFLFPNALYAEVDVNYDDNTMTLIRGHQYPPPESPANGFNYEIEERFHKYEYDNQCLEWKFVEIENGFHLNCYPDAIIFKNLDILLKMKELT